MVFLPYNEVIIAANYSVNYPLTVKAVRGFLIYRYL